MIKKISLIQFVLALSLLMSPILITKHTPKRMALIDNPTKIYSPVHDKLPTSFVKLGEFYTDFSRSSENRKHNISLACHKINGMFLESGAEFSFNHTVGPRTEKNGFKSAKIIFSGQFIDGIGGGVCQVSTTLYNAAICSGMVITENHPHSLLVNYVSPSQDAMVNAFGSDLKFINPYNSRVYIQTTTINDRITVSFFGQECEYTYKLESVIDEYLPPFNVIKIFDEDNSYPDLKYGQEKVLSYGTNGAKSRAFLVCEQNGTVVYKKLFRTDNYSPSNIIIIQGRACNDEG